LVENIRGELDSRAYDLSLKIEDNHKEILDFNQGLTRKFVTREEFVD